MDFAVSRPLVRHWRLLFGFCSSTRTFVPCFLRTSPRGDSPCIITRPSPPSGRPEDFHLQVTEHAQHTTKPLARRTLSRVWGRQFVRDHARASLPHVPACYCPTRRSFLHRWHVSGATAFRMPSATAAGLCLDALAISVSLLRCPQWEQAKKTSALNRFSVIRTIIRS
jgi:hypothetical protein